MKVLHLIPDLGLGGAQRVLCYLAAAVDRTHVRLQVVYWGGDHSLRKELEDLGVEVVYLAGVGHSLRRLAIALGRHLRKDRPEIIHTHLFDADLVGILLAKGLGISPCFSTIHSSTFFSCWWHRLRYRCLAVLVRRFFPVSHALEEILIRRCWVPATKVQVIRNGIDLRRYAPMPARMDETDLGPVIGTLARLDILKGVRYLLEAMAMLLRDLPNARLVIGGEGAEHETLRRQARDLGIDGRVAFVGPVHDPPGFYRRLDLFVFPSLDEGFGMVVLEAMGMSLPVIGTRVGGVPEILEHEVNGVLVAPGDSGAIAASVRALWGNPGHRRRLAEEGRRTAVKFDIALTAVQMQAEYERLA